MTSVTAAFTAFLVKERNLKSKHLQILSGIQPLAYWTSNFLWDMITYIAISICLMGVFFAYQNNEFIRTHDTAAATYMLILLYGFSAIPLSYCYQFNFSTPTGLVWFVSFRCVLYALTTI